MGPPTYMQSVIDRNVDMRRMTVYKHSFCNSFIMLDDGPV